MGACLAVSAGLVLADGSYLITAQMPDASSVKFTASNVINKGLNPSDWSDVTGTELTFAGMHFDDVKDPVTGVAPNIWRATNFFAIDVANVGPGSPNVTSVTYTEGPKPQTKGLGYKANLVIVKGVYQSADVVLAGHTKRPLRSVIGESVSSADTAGGWARIYIGLADGKVASEGEPFTNADLPGKYSGTLTISASVK